MKKILFTICITCLLACGSAVARPYYNKSKHKKYYDVQKLKKRVVSPLKKNQYKKIGTGKKTKSTYKRIQPAGKTLSVRIQYESVLLLLIRETLGEAEHKCIKNCTQFLYRK